MKEPVIRQKNTRSCDYCAIKKQKCHQSGFLPASPSATSSADEGSSAPQCLACKELNQPCTYDREIKKRGMKIGFVQKLKKEIFHLQTLVEQQSLTEAGLQEGELIRKSANSVPSRQTGIMPLPIIMIPRTTSRASTNSGDSLNSSLEFNVNSANTVTVFSTESPGSIKSNPHNNSSGGGSTVTNSHSILSSESSKSSLKNVQGDLSSTNLFGQMSLDSLGLAFASIDGSTRPSSSNIHAIRERSDTIEGFPSESKVIPSPVELGHLELHSSNMDSDSLFDSYENLSNWSVLTFYLLTIQNAEGKTDGFLNAYFINVWPKIPLFNKLWCLDNMADLPLWLLHIMYACCLISEADVEMKKLAAHHYEYCVKTVMNQLDRANPFHIAALLHCMIYSMMNDASSKAHISHLGTCVQIGQILGLHTDKEIFWSSPIGTALGSDKTPLNQNFVRTIWFLIYRYDWAMYIVHDHDFFVGTSLNEAALKKWIIPIMPMENVGTYYREHYLYHFHLLGPVLESVKTALYSQNEDDFAARNYRLESLVDIDNNLSKVPAYSSVAPTKGYFCDASIRHFHETYNFARICLLKSDILHCASKRTSSQPPIAILACKKSAKIITELANSLKHSNCQPEYYSEMVHVYYHTGLFLILIGYLCGELEQMRQSVDVLIGALRMLIPEDSKEIMILYEFNPELAYDSLNNCGGV